MTFNQLLEYCSGNVRTFGATRALQDVLYQTARKVIDVRVLRGMTAELSDVNRDLLSSGDFTARFLDPDTVGRAFAEPEWRHEYSPAWIEAALSKGDRCFGVFDGPVLASVGWYATTPTPVTDTLSLHFDPTWVYMHRGFTARAYRGRRLHGIGMSLALREVTARGAKGLISFVECNNLQSLQSVDRMGYRVFGSIWLAALSDRQWAWATPGCRAYRFRLASSPRCRASYAVT
jgi:hypothetical protein